MGETSWITFVAAHSGELWLRTLQHIMLTGVSSLVAVAVGVPLGIVALRVRWIRGPILAAVGILQTVPSLAMLVLLLALLHKIGALPAIIALTLYALLPIVRNTVTGLQGISPQVLEAARGIGMTQFQEMRMVRLPLALPVMVAGIRTAAVMGVGIATLSAFIGAGGLGQFINQGLAQANTRLILLGAIPAAILALVVDQTIAVSQWALDPRRGGRVCTTRKKVLLSAAVILPIILFGGGVAGYVRNRPDVTIGSKNFTEQILLGEMLAQLVEDHTDLTVDRRFCLGGTMICHGALVHGEIDLYVEYTGTGLMTVLHHDVLSDPQEVYRIVSEEYRRRFGVEWCAPLGFNNGYALTVRRQDCAASRLENHLGFTCFSVAVADWLSRRVRPASRRLSGIAKGLWLQVWRSAGVGLRADVRCHCRRRGGRDSGLHHRRSHRRLRSGDVGRRSSFLSAVFRRACGPSSRRSAAIRSCERFSTCWPESWTTRPCSG